MATGFLLFLATLHGLSRGRKGRDANYLSNLLTLLILSALAGARAAYVAMHWSEYAQNPWAVLNVNEGGLVFYGGLLAAWLALSLFARAHRERQLDFLDLVVTGLPIGHAVGRIGCFLEGCCFGIRCGSSLGVRYPVGSHLWRQQFDQGLIGFFEPPFPVVPTQLIEAAANAAIFGLLLWHYPRRRKEGEQIALYAALYAPVRFATELLRADERMPIGPFTVSQAVSLGILAFAAGLALYLRRRGRPVVHPAENE